MDVIHLSLLHILIQAFWHLFQYLSHIGQVEKQFGLSKYWR